MAMRSAVQGCKLEIINLKEEIEHGKRLILLVQDFARDGFFTRRIPNIRKWALDSDKSPFYTDPGPRKLLGHPFRD